MQLITSDRGISHWK